METVSDYELWKSNRQATNVNQAQVVLGASQDSPDQVAGDMKLASEFGKATGNPVPPLPLVKEYRPIFQQEIERKKNETILSSSPMLTEWLKSPDRASLVRDDLENLSWFEGFGRGFVNTVGRAKERLGQQYNTYRFEQTAERAQDRQRTFGQIIESERETVQTARGDVQLPIRVGDVASAAGRWIDARFADLIGTDDEASAREFATAMQGNVDRLRAIPKSGIATEAEKLMFQDDATLGQAVQNIGTAIVKNPLGVLSWALETAGESSPQIAAAVGATIVTKRPAVGILTSGAGSYASERYSAPADYFAEKGLDLKKPEDVTRVMTDPALMKEAADRGVIRGLIIGTFDTLSAGLAGRALAGNPLVEALAQGLQQAVGGSAGEYLARVAAGQDIDWNEIIAEGLAEIATAPIDMGIAGRNLMEMRRKAKAAETTLQKVGELSAQAGASKTRERSADVFRDAVAASLATSPASTMYVPAGEFVQFFQSRGLDPFEAVSALDGVTREDLDAALLSNGDLSIPTATFAAKIAGSELEPFFAENAKFDPLEMSAREAAEFNARSDDAMQEAWDEAEAQRLQDEELRSFEQEIYDTTVANLRAAGRSTDVATTEALLYPAFYKALSGLDRSGLTMEELLRRYPLPKVAGSLPEGMQLRDVDALNRTLAEARKFRGETDKRQTLLEFIDGYGGINDRGGELKARDAVTVKRGKSKKTLKLARGGVMDGMRDMFGSQSAGKKYGPDDVAQAAIEAGFMADDPIVAEWKAAVEAGREVPDITRALYDAIDRELRGEAQYAYDPQADRMAEEQARLADIEAYLSSLNVSLDDGDQAIREAIAADQARQYGQTARDIGGELAKIKDDAEAAGVTLNVRGNSELIRVEWIENYGGEKGAAASVMRSLTDLADQVGAKMWLEAFENDPFLVRYYKQFGFKAQEKGDGGRVMRRDPRAPGKLLFQDTGGMRGSIQFPAAGVGSGDTVIRLFQSADLSTFLHESGHFFLTVMQDLSRDGGPIAEDFGTVKAWWRDNAKAVAKDANSRMPDAKVTADDVIAALDNGTTGDTLKDAAVDVGMQEQFARGFEQYLMEGKAPSTELRSAFEKFRSWLISVYRSLAGLNVQVSDDLRRVFDRMLASDEEIAKAQADLGHLHPLFPSAEEMGLTQEEYDAYLKLRSQAEDEAKSRLLKEAMAPVKRAKEQWFKDERAAVRAEVEREVNGYRYYRALEWMGNRRWLGDGKPTDLPDFRLSKSVLVERYGAGVLDTLPRGKQTIYSVEGGIDPDDAAGWFGFTSGDEMIQALERAPKRSEAIDAETDKIMRERHGDILNDGQIEAEALAAVHNDKRGEWIAAELKSIADVAGLGKMMTMKEARATARSTMSTMKVRDAVNSNRYLAAERKAADEAARLGAQLAREKIWLDASKRQIASKARAVIRGEASPDAVAKAVDNFNARFETTTSTYSVGDQQRTTPAGNTYTIKGGERTSASLGYNDLVAKLVAAKRRQLINHALYMESVQVADEVEKAERYVAKLSKKEKREKIAGAGRRANAQVDYLAAIDEIVERYDFRKLSGRAEERRGALNAFIEAMTAAGRENEIAIPEAVLRDAARRPYKTLPVEELRGVVDSLKNLEHVALRWNKLIDAQQQRDLDEAVEGIVANFDANLPKRPPGRVGTASENARNGVRQYLDLVLNAGTLLREIDGFEDLGAAYRNMKSPIDDAMNRLIVRKEKAATDLEALYSVYSKDERRRMAVREFIPSLGYSLSKWERIAVALNTGNEGNYQRLTDTSVRGAMTEDQVRAVLDTLDARDARFVQSVWDYVGSFRDDIAARERRTTGVEPKWVEAKPVTIAGVSLKGGYYPLKYDPRLSSLARDDETQEIAQSLQAGRFGKAQTRNGHLKARAQSSGRDIELDMSVLHRHVNQVVYDLELSEPVSNSWRILQDGRVRSAFRDAGRQADFDALETWLKDVAEGEIRSADLVGRAARSLKSNFTAAKLAFNLGSVMIQVTGLSQSMVVAGKKNMAIGIMQAAKDPVGLSRDIAAKSVYMRTRQTTFNKDIYDFYSDPKTGPVATRWGEIKSEIIGPLAFWLMTKVQWHLVDVPTWMAGYRQGLAKYGNDEAQAIAHADSIVKRAQASGLFSDRSAIERGSVTRTARQNDVIRLFTALGSYMFAKFNVAYERSRRAGRVIQDEGLSIRSAREALSYAVDIGFLFTLEAVLAAAIRGQLPDDDDEEDDGWLTFLAKQTGFSVMGTLPGIRDLAGPLQGFDGGGAYGSITKELAAPFKEIGQGEVDKGLVKSIITSTALFTGIPSTQINRMVDAGWRQAEGEDVAPIEYVVGKIGK